MGSVQEAIQLYRAATECDPYRASYHRGLAQALSIAGKNDQAIEQFRLARALNPTKQRYANDLSAAQETLRQAGTNLVEFPPAKKDE